MLKEAMKERATDIFNSVDNIIAELKEIKDLAAKMKDTDTVSIATMNTNITMKLSDVIDSLQEL